MPLPVPKPTSFTTSKILLQKHNLEEACKIFEDIQHVVKNKERAIIAFCNILKEGLENEEKREAEIENLKHEVKTLQTEQRELKAKLNSQPSQSTSPSTQLEAGLKSRLAHIEQDLKLLNQTIQDQQEELIQWGVNAAQQLKKFEKEIHPTLVKLDPLDPINTSKSEDTSSQYQALDKLVNFSIESHNQTLQIINRTIARLETNLKAKESEVQASIERKEQLQAAGSKLGDLDQHIKNLWDAYHKQSNKLNQTTWTQVASLNTTLFLLEKRITSHEKAQNTLKEKVTRLDQKVQQLQQENSDDRTSFDSQLSAIKTKIDQLSQQGPNLQKQAEDIQAQNQQSLDRRIQALEAQIISESQLKKISQPFQGHLAALQADIKKLGAIQNTWKGNFSNIEKKFNEINRQFVSLHDKMSQCENRIQALEIRVDNHEIRIIHLETQTNPFHDPYLTPKSTEEMKALFLNQLSESSKLPEALFLEKIDGLISEGASLDQRLQNEFCTPSLIEVAVKNNWTEVAKKLIEHKVPVTDRTPPSPQCYPNQHTCENRFSDTELYCLMSNTIQASCFSKIVNSVFTGHTLSQLKDLLLWLSVFRFPKVAHHTYEFAEASKVLSEYTKARDTYDIETISTMVHTAFNATTSKQIDSLLLMMQLLLNEDPKDNLALSALQSFAFKNLPPHFLPKALDRFKPCIATTLMHLAVINNNKVLVDLLYQRQAYLIQSPDEKGRTPLEIAALYNHPTMVHHLIALGALITPNTINLAAFGLGTESIKALEAGYTISLPAKNHTKITQRMNPIFDEARMKTALPSQAHFELFDCKDTQEILIQAYSQTPGEYPLHSALANNNLDIPTQYLKTKCPDPNWQNREGKTILFMAVAKGNRAMVDLALDKKADPNLPDNKGYFPLFEAARQNKVEVAKILLERGANPNQQINYGDTASHAAVHWCAPGVFDLLILHGADFGIENSQQKSAPFVFPEYSREQMENCLRIAERLQALCKEELSRVLNMQSNLPEDGGACWQKLSNDISTAKTHLATQCEEQRHFVQANLNKGKGYYAIHQAVRKGDLNRVTEYFEQVSCADINEQDLNGQTFMDLAAKFGHVDIMETLYKKGADLEILDKEGLTVLQLAVLQEQKAVVQRLAEWARSDLKVLSLLNSETEKTPTALYIAADKGYTDIVASLVAGGANVSQCTLEADWCPIHAAIQNCDEKTAYELLISKTSLPAMLTRDKVQNKLPLEIFWTQEECHLSLLKECLASKPVPCSWEMYHLLSTWCTDNAETFESRQPYSKYESLEEIQACASLIDQQSDNLRAHYFEYQGDQNHQASEQEALPIALALQQVRHNVTEAQYHDLTLESSANKEQLIDLFSVFSEAGTLFKAPFGFGFLNGAIERITIQYITPILSPNNPLCILTMARLGLKTFPYALNVIGNKELSVSFLFIILGWRFSVDAEWMQSKLGEKTFKALNRLFRFFENIYSYDPILCSNLLLQLFNIQHDNEVGLIFAHGLLQLGILPMVHQIGYALGDGFISMLPEPNTIKAATTPIAEALQTAASTVFSARFFKLIKRNTCLRWCKPKETGFEMKEITPQAEQNIALLNTHSLNRAIGL